MLWGSAVAHLVECKTDYRMVASLKLAIGSLYAVS